MSWLLDPRLSNCRRIFLRNVTLEANIGIYDAERGEKQKILVNVDLFVSLTVSTPRRDKIAEVVDYDFVRAAIRERIDRGHINLQETLVDDVARALLQHPAVIAARVSCEKPGIYADAEGVGIEAFYFKGQ